MLAPCRLQSRGNFQRTRVSITVHVWGTQRIAYRLLSPQTSTFWESKIIAVTDMSRNFTTRYPSSPTISPALVRDHGHL